MSLLPVLRESSGQSATVLPLLDCNARCPFCSTRVYTKEGVLSPIDWREGRKRRAKDYTLSTEELCRALDELINEGIRRVSIQGGEPTLHPGLCELIEHGWRRGLEEQTVVSNGRRFADASFTRRFVQAAPSTLVLSIFGDTREVHDASLGVHGAFDDLEAGVRHLLESGAGRVGRKPSMLAQLTLHSGNFSRLPQTLAHWYERGLRDFGVRLLRETDNTRQDGTPWFFDLAALEAPLGRALDFALGHPDLALIFSELPRCMVPNSHLPQMLLDLGSNPNLGGGNRQVSRHFDLKVKQRLGSSSASACDECELQSMCLPPEGPWARASSRALRSLRLDSALDDFISAPASDSRTAGIERLLAKPKLLKALGISIARHRALVRSSVEGAQSGAALQRAVFSERMRVELAARLKVWGKTRVQIRALTFEAAGVNGLLFEDSVIGNEKVRDALKRLTRVELDAFVGAWMHQASGGSLVLTLLHDPEAIPEEVLLKATGTLFDGAVR